MKVRKLTLVLLTFFLVFGVVSYALAQNQSSVPPIETWQFVEAKDWIYSETFGDQVIETKAGINHIYQKPSSSIQGAFLTFFDTDKVILKAWWTTPFKKDEYGSIRSTDSDLQVALIINKDHVVIGKKGCQARFALGYKRDVGGKLKAASLRITITKQSGENFTHTFYNK